MGRGSSRDWSRRDVLRAGLGASASSLLACSGDEEGEELGPDRILFITADDLGWKDLSSSGNPNLQTPNLDRLRQGGVCFSHAFDVTSTCASSRTTYATGQYPHTHGVVGLVHRFPEMSLPESAPTLAKHLRQAGYTTAIEGKFHLAFPQTADPYGYDEVMTTVLTQWIQSSSATIDFIRRMGEQRWFFEVNYMNPHRNALGQFVQHPDHPIDPEALTIPDYVRLPDLPGAREELAAYYSQVERMDAMIGEVIATLEELGLFSNTLITFISDNGSPFPGNKLTLYDRGTGTPWFFHWPAVIAAGSERREMVSSVDLMPTILELAGLAVPGEVQGESLAPFVLGRDDVPHEQAVFGEMTTHVEALFPMRSVRYERYRYIRNYNDQPIPLEGADQPWVQQALAEGVEGYGWGEKRVPEELYDLAQDPHETVNLVDAPDHAEALDTLRGRLDYHMQQTADPYLGKPFEEVAG